MESVKTFLVAISLSAPFVLQAQYVIKGKVYEDSNGNGKKEYREKELARVAVSNGEKIVLTDEEGRYELPVGKDNAVFIIKPSDYKSSTNEDNLPQFFYLHKPNGSPVLKYAGVSPTGNQPRSLDFGLVPVEEKESFSVLIFGDPQPYTEQQVDFFSRGIISEVEGIEGVTFGLSLGDLVGDNLDLFNPYIQAVKNVGIPWYNLMGNHDMNLDVTVDSLSDETFEAHFGPANYAFNYGMVHFIVLDNILYPDPRDQKGYWGGFREDQLNFIENDLKHVPKDHLIVLAFHIPISESGGEDTFRDEDRQQLFNLLKDFPHTLSLSAHTHIQKQDFFGREEGWQQEKPHHHYNVGTTSGSWYSGRLNEEGIPVSTMRDGTPKGYAFINFKGNDYVIDYKAAGHPQEYQMNIYAPKVVWQNEETSAGIYVNFFMGSKEDKVMYRIDNGNWEMMDYKQEFDPGYLHLLHEWDFTEEPILGSRPPNFKGAKHLSRHLWRGNVPVRLPVGEHTIEVKASDMFGRTFTQKSSYRIESVESSK